MNSDSHDARERADQIASEFFGCVAGCYDTCVEQLQSATGSVPTSVRLTLCLEPLYYGLSFFGESSRERYTDLEREQFVAELDKTIRWFFITIMFQPKAVGFAPPSTPESLRIVQRSATEVVTEERGLTKEQEEAIRTFSHWREIRERQFQQRLARRFDRFRARLYLTLAHCLDWQRQQPPIDIELDTGWLLAALKLGLAQDEYRCPESLLRDFAEHVVAEAYRIRAECI